MDGKNSKINEMIRIPFGNLTLALDSAQLDLAIKQGREWYALHNGQTPQATGDRILPSEQLEAETSVPASWWLQAACENTIPHLKCGKYTSFKMSDVVRALEVRSERRLNHTARRTLEQKKT